jgi:ADP-ribose pyrophosphatase
MDYTEKKLRTVNGYRGIVVNIDVDRVELPNGVSAFREVVSHPGGVAILALDGEKNVICVRQYRYCFGDHLLEIPAGKLGYGEDPFQCAVRELGEETGITAGTFTPLGSIYPSPGYSREVLHLYLAEDLHYGKSHPDQDEFLDVLRIPFARLTDMVMSGEIHDGKTVAAVLKAKIYLEGRQ